MFFETAAAFGALSLYGYTTRRDLSAMGSFLAMGVFGLIIASVVNIFLQSTGLQWALSMLGIGIFAGLTAWDTQSIKASYYAGGTWEAAEKKSIFGALTLYLDFINMFQFLLMMLRRPPQLSRTSLPDNPAAATRPGFYVRCGSGRGNVSSARRPCG